MRIGRSAVFLSLSSVTACTTAPPPPSVESGYTADLVLHAKCEMRLAADKLKKRYDWLSGWAAGFDINIKYENNGAVRPSTSILAPISQGVFGLDAGGSFYRSASGASVVKFRSGFSETSKLDCDTPRRRDVLIDGKIGLYEWMAQSITSISNKSDAGGLTGTGRTIEFYTEYTAGITPSIKITQDSGRVNSGSSIFGAGRKETQTITVAIAGPSGPTPVFVTNFPPLPTVQHTPSRGYKRPFIAPAAATPSSAIDNVNRTIQDLKDDIRKFEIR